MRAERAEARRVAKEAKAEAAARSRRDKDERKRQRAAEKQLRKQEAAAAKAIDDVPPPPSLGRRGISASAVWSLVVGAFGMLCMVLALVLAIGALLLALGNDSGDLYGFVSSACDALVGPLRGAFTFSGANADLKETLVAWGAGALTYLVVGLGAQLYQRTLADD